VQITPDHVVDLGHRLDNPEIGIVDRLLSGVRDGTDVGNLARPAIVDATRQLFGMGEQCFGMTDAYGVKRHSGWARVTLAMDSCCGTNMEFDLRRRGGHAVITHFACH